MLNYTLDPRCMDILKSLLYADGYLSVQDLSEEKNISRRSVYYDLCKINEWLETYNVAPIEVERKKGIFITQEHAEQIKEVLKTVPTNVAYLFSPMERVKIIICSIMKKVEPLYIEDFMSLCEVSRNTIINDLKVVSRKLQEFNLSLVYENKRGYRIEGDIIRKRTVFFLYFNSLIEFYKKGFIALDNEEKVNEILDRLKKIEKKLNAEYVSGVLFSISVFFASIEKRTDNVEFSDMDKDEITNTKEYQLVNEYFCELKESERLYLALHLLGSRLQTVPMDLMKKEEDQEAYELAKSLIAEFSRLACVDFEEVEEVEQALFAHLKTSLYRYRYGIQLGNPMLDDIKNEYSELFEITKKACEYLEQQIGVPIPDGEIAYITLHFGGFMNASVKQERPKELRVLIVCPNGISTGNMLRGEVQTLVPHAEKIDVISLTQYQKNHGYDVVVATVMIEDEPNLTIVHPILTDNDRVTILRKCMKNDSKNKMEVEGIIDIAKKYIDKAKIDYFKEDLVNYFSSINIGNVVPKKDFGFGIMNYLNETHIRFVKTACDWQQSIKIAAQSLLDSGAIEDKYIDNIIVKNNELGPCMFITEKVVLAHAKVEEGALHLGVSLTLFSKPIYFEKKEARIVIVLSAEDQVKHLRILNDIMTIFSVKKNIDALLTCENEKEVLHLMNEILEREDENHE